MTIKKVYISGKISGLDRHEVSNNFYRAQEYLVALGFDVVNPLELYHVHKEEWSDCMKTDIKAMLDCDIIYMLSNWRNSLGARLENLICKRLGIKIYYESKSRNIIDEKTTIDEV